MYDVSAAHTFDDCATWLAVRFLMQHPIHGIDCGGGIRVCLRRQEVRAHAAEGVPVLLVGNKIDLAEAGSRAVPQDWGRVFAEVRGGGDARDWGRVFAEVRGGGDAWDWGRVFAEVRGGGGACSSRSTTRRHLVSRNSWCCCCCCC